MTVQDLMKSLVNLPWDSEIVIRDDRKSTPTGEIETVLATVMENNIVTIIVVRIN